MMELDSEFKRLLVSAAMAAPHYGLLPQARTILKSFRYLGLKQDTGAMARAMVYLGLRQPSRALRAIQSLQSAEADQLRATIRKVASTIRKPI